MWGAIRVLKRVREKFHRHKKFEVGYKSLRAQMTFYLKKYFWWNYILQCLVITKWPSLYHIVMELLSRFRIENTSDHDVVPYFNVMAFQMIEFFILFQPTSRRDGYTFTSWYNALFINIFASPFFEDTSLWFISTYTFTLSNWSPVSSRGEQTRPKNQETN